MWTHLPETYLFTFIQEMHKANFNFHEALVTILRQRVTNI